ncbi:MAG TPA: methionine--tRNA ligase [Terriglobales bacterium]|nr:methionine--tRNA ligase [Terriglobales bacterium]
MDNRKPEKFYITTPIYYVNARPHIGHTYTTVVCDTIARRQRMMGVDTWFLTGTDEHGQKIERSAAAAGCSPKEFADKVSGEFRALWDRMKITYDDFIRTTEPRHIRGVQAMFTRLQERGYIYKGSYSGQYCVSDELYVDAVGPGAPCPECGRPTETVQEENYFFKLSAMQEPLLKYYAEHPDFIRPETRRNEVIAFVRGGLRDLSVSRTSFKWGIPVPGDPKHIVYVWLDALTNYMTAIGFGSDDPKDKEKLARYWPADVHMIGKEIVRFHCVYWPAFLLAADLPLPRSIVAHGWLLFEESKMSKSRGNIVRSETILDTLGQDALRYFLLREIVFGQDGSFSFDALVQRYNADLANDLGNLSSRTLSMIARYFEGEIPYPSATSRTAADEAIEKLTGQTITDFHAQFEQYQFSRALETAWTLIAAVNKYIVENEPWAVAEREDRDSRARLAMILRTSVEALRVVTALLYPVMPDATARIWKQLGLGEITELELPHLIWGQIENGTKLGRVEPVFPRADKSLIERMQKMEQQRSAESEAKAAEDQSQSPGKGAQAAQPVTHAAIPQSAAAATPAGSPPGATAPAAKISADDFFKVEMRVGEVKVAEKVKGADKLLRLEVDIGTEVRQVVAGIAKAYDPEKLIGRKVVIVANLQPRKLRGLESNGMIVAASVGDDGQPVLAGFLEDVPVGAKLK